MSINPFAAAVLGAIACVLGFWLPLWLVLR